MKWQKFWLLIAFVVLMEIITLNPARAEKPPPGFKVYKVKWGDTFSKIAPRQAWLLIKKVNRIDRLYAGRKIFVPTDLELARQYCPAPRQIPGFAKIKKIILVNVHPRAQWFSAYEFGQLVYWGPVSSGRRFRRTPTGVYRVCWKTKYYYSKKYKADMPYSLCINNQIGLFIHQQKLPGRPDSHGCIRLLMTDAKWLFSWAEIKIPVWVISRPPAEKEDENNGPKPGEEGTYLANSKK